MALAIVASGAILVASCTSDGGPPSGSATTTTAAAGAEPPAGASGPGVRVTQIAQLPIMLTSFDASPDGRDLLVGDRQGVIRRLVRTDIDGAKVPVLEDEPILDLSAEVSLLGERGAFDLKFVGDGRFLVVSYTALNGTITLERFPYNPGQKVVRSDGVPLVERPHPYAWHHGGGIAVAEDGDVYWAIGDMEFRQFDPPGPQDPNLLLGGILHLPAAVVEAENPSWAPTGADMVARGMRNPWRISLDRSSGDLWIGDVGLADVEEVDHIPAEDLGGPAVNFGWPYLEGSRSNEGAVPAGVEVVDPVHERIHEPGVCGIVGGFVYRGRSLTDMTGRYIYGDLCAQELRSFLPDGDRAEDDDTAVELAETIISLGQDRAGELYLLGSAGGLYRLDPAGWNAPPNPQKPTGPKQTTTTIARTTQNCDGVVAATEPLARIGAMTPEELQSAFEEANAKLASLVPTLPDSIKGDAEIVQQVLVDISTALASDDWDPGATALDQLRSEAYQGTGRFSEFPEAMARIVDSECG